MMVRINLSAGGAQIEAETGLSQDADLLAVQIMERLEEALGASTPPAR